MDEENKVMVSYRYEYSDVMSAFFENFFTNLQNIFTMIMVGLCLFGFIFLLIYTNITTVPDRFEDYFYLLLIVLCMIFLLRPVFMMARISTIWRSTHRIPKDYSWAFTKEQIIFSRIFGQLVYPWSYFMKITEQKSSFCFHVSLQDYYVIPKRAMTEEQIAQLQQMILTSINVQITKVKLKKRKGVKSE